MNNIPYSFWYAFGRNILLQRILGLKVFIFIMLLILIPSRFAFAYRPFVSTDADVAEKGELEIEFGLLNVHIVKGIDKIIVPGLIFNYGIMKNWELVSEFDVQVYREGKERNFELKEPAQFLKGIVREGILQDKKGPSIAVEIGVLFPSTIKGSRKTGVEGIVIVSSRISDLIYHINFGGEMDRESFAFNGLWGIIMEKPLNSNLRFVMEVNGVVKRSKSPENLVLAGFILEAYGIDIDFGIRKGLSDNTKDLELTSGFTVAF
ncbi:MAG TPA: hypothetical protein ENH82_15355 [bacterium]|nr:hypothetical protein [bacterium]